MFSLRINKMLHFAFNIIFAAIVMFENIQSSYLLVEIEDPMPIDPTPPQPLPTKPQPLPPTPPTLPPQPSPAYPPKPTKVPGRYHTIQINFI